MPDTSQTAYPTAEASTYPVEPSATVAGSVFAPDSFMPDVDLPGAAYDLNDPPAVEAPTWSI